MKGKEKGKEKEKRRVFNPSAMMSYIVVCSVVLFFDFTLLGKPTIPFVPRPVAYILGSLLASFGVGLMIASIITVRRALKTGKLIRTGVFALMRHPIYAAYTYFLTPGGGLILNKLAGLLIMPIVYSFVLHYFVVKPEEETLIAEFGQEYLDYKQEVNAYFPTITCRKKKPT